MISVVPGRHVICVNKNRVFAGTGNWCRTVETLIAEGKIAPNALHDLNFYFIMKKKPLKTRLKDQTIKLIEMVPLDLIKSK